MSKINSENIFIVCGATSGFGGAVSKKLLEEGNNILAVARTVDNLESLKSQYPGQVECIAGNLAHHDTLESIQNSVKDKYLNGIFLNSGGPPAKSIGETSMNDWDQAYYTLLRWKVELTKMLLPKFKEQEYGRILFLESSSVKQPIENLVLSTSLRLGVVGYAKTLSEEIADKGITVNILAPGFHDTQALSRLFSKKAKNEGITEDEAKQRFMENIKVGFIGDPDELASLASWLLSSESKYITGQTISVDGGVIKGVFG
jgi:3-oxoacyl-[acyl-carrier protein] reductase